MVNRREFGRIMRKSAGTLSAYEHYLLSVEYEHRLDAESLETGLDHAARSIALDSSFARTRLIHDMLLSNTVTLLGRSLTAEVLAKMKAEIGRAYEADPRDPRILACYGRSRALEGDLEEATRLIVRAADLAFNQADPTILCANTFATIVGDISGAKALFNRALRLNPTPPRWYRFVEARVRFFAVEFEACLATARGCAGFLSGELYGALAQAMVGGPEEVAAARQRLAERFPTLDFAAHARGFPVTAPQPLSIYRDAVDRLETISA